MSARYRAIEAGLSAWGISYNYVAGGGLLFEWAGFPLLTDHRLLTDHHEILDAFNVEEEFDANFANRADLAARLVKVLEAVAAGDCLSCRSLACRISMLIKDLEDEVAHEKTIKEF